MKNYMKENSIYEDCSEDSYEESSEDSCNTCDEEKCKNLLLPKVTKHYINSNVQYISDDWVNSVTLNPWGIVALEEKPCCPANVYWVANNGSRKLCKYFRSGQLYEQAEVNDHLPTGLVYNYTDFYGQYKLITVTLDGTIEGLKVDINNKAATSTEVIKERIDKELYTGVDLNKDNLYVCDFYNGNIEMYDNNFNFIKNFDKDDALFQSGYCPYNVIIDCGYVYVAFAKKSDVGCGIPSIGFGYIDKFSLDGELLYRFVSRDPLNAPWGLAFSECGKYLYVGNTGDGKINIFDKCSQEFIGPIMDKNCNPVQIGNLWGLASNLNRLIFTSGIDGSPENCGDSANGLIGYLRLID